MNSKREKGEGKRDSAKRRRWIVIVLAASLFPLLATLNSAGYRFGASDQAFYAPAILKSIDADLFPRDSELIRSQARLTLVDDVVGPVARAAGIELPTLFAILQTATLALLALAALRIGRSLYQTTWAAAAFVAALTIRHAIVRSGTNTLEGYFHPRQLSFALGALAVGDFLRGRYTTMAVLLAVAGALHPTTGTWVAVWLAVATFIAEKRLRPLLIAGGCAGLVLAAWALTAGPLAGRLIVMDDEWFATLSSKEYLFPLQWPAVAWLINLGYIPLIVAIHRWRRSAGAAVERETALVGGCLALALVFAASLPLNAAHVALAIQLQPARIFWMLDFLAIALVVWAIAEGTAISIRRARFAAAGILAFAIARGCYVMFVEFPERRIAQIDFSDDDWGRAMRWARATPKATGWLAEADHAARYGTSVRVAAHRDVFVEAIKDGAVGMYDRAVAMRTRDRVHALGDFNALTPEHARVLAREYDLDYLVTENAVDLPLAFTSGKLRIYRLRN